MNKIIILILTCVLFSSCKQQAEISKVYKQKIPATRFIGKMYLDKDRKNGSFSIYWKEWETNNWFNTIKANCTSTLYSESTEDNAKIGLMRWKENEDFQYWIGLFTPKDTIVPLGFDYIDFDEGNLGVCWLYGKANTLVNNEIECDIELQQEGYKIVCDKNNAWWFFERYNQNRYTLPDKKGKVILDICHFIE